ncbi:MerR family transcriptional regulator, partial [Legionella sp. 29fVS95]|uniref:MerR family transcriptional regulator n=1 Tax=Legionella sp. 29fVS95 TaxID=3402813 RepID=UPI003AF98429
FYDEIALLKPAYYGGNQYRYYKEEQLLMLQQILFFRELGFPLKCEMVLSIVLMSVAVRSRLDSKADLCLFNDSILSKSSLL